jgi:hypothetical protein
MQQVCEFKMMMVFLLDISNLLEVCMIIMNSQNHVDTSVVIE